MSKALLKYYYDVTRYNLAFSVLIGVLRGVTPAIISLGTFGMFIGVICFGYLQNNQYYFYHNLGFTKLRLILTVWGINLILAVLILLIASYV
jgi:hypothetical protein